MFFKLMTQLIARPTAFMLALSMAMGTLIADDRIAIKASPCGPAQALQDAGKSIYLVPALEHKNGDKLMAAEVRHAPDAVFYLPKDATPDKKMFMAFISAEMENDGPATGGCASGKRGPPCEGELTATKAKLTKAEADLAAAEKRAKEADEKLKAAMADLNKSISPWWLLLAFALGFIPFLFARSGRKTAEAERDAANASLKRVPPDVQTAQNDRDKAIENAEKLQKQFADLSGQFDRFLAEKWGNLDALHARIAQLNNPVTN